MRGRSKALPALSLILGVRRFAIALPRRRLAGPADDPERRLTGQNSGHVSNWTFFPSQLQLWDMVGLVGKEWTDQTFADVWLNVYIQRLPGPPPGFYPYSSPT